jgi:type IV pilus assembly protein PilW
MKGCLNKMEKKNGYTLIELMISIAIFGIVMTGIYQTFHSQQRSYLKQEQVVDLQQNMRAGQYFIARDIKMAGYDPWGNAEATITTANIAQLDFQADLDGSGVIGDGPMETVQYALTSDSDTDGIADNFPCSLGRQYNGAGGFQPVCDNVEALEFCYVLDNGTALLAPPDADRMSRIRSIIVSMMIRSENIIKGGYTNNLVYTQASNDVAITPDLTGAPPEWGPFNDHYKRRMTVARVRCRNMGTAAAP